MTPSNAPTVGPPAEDVNPLFMRPRPLCKGVILMGCNSLSYQSVRLRMNQIFPNALIIGYVDRTPLGDQALVPILNCCRKGFFEKPPTDHDSLRLLVRSMNKAYPFPSRQGSLVLQHGNRLYCSQRRSKSSDYVAIHHSYARIVEIILRAR